MKATKEELKRAFLVGADYEARVVMELVEDIGWRDAFEKWYGKKKRKKSIKP